MSSEDFKQPKKKPRVEEGIEVSEQLHSDIPVRFFEGCEREQLMMADLLGHHEYGRLSIENEEDRARNEQTGIQGFAAWLNLKLFASQDPVGFFQHCEREHRQEIESLETSSKDLIVFKVLEEEEDGDRYEWEVDEEICRNFIQIEKYEWFGA